MSEWVPPQGYRERRAEILAIRADDERDGGIAVGRPPLNPTLAQLELLIAVVEYGSNKAVAGALGVSEQTVKNHMSDILWRLQAKSRTHAVLIAWPILVDAFPMFPEPMKRTGWVRREKDRQLSTKVPRNVALHLA